MLLLILTTLLFPKIIFCLIKIPIGINQVSKRSIGNNVIPLSTSYEDLIFSGMFYYGTNEQPVHVAFDTGSYTINVQYKYGTYCNGNNRCDEYGYYDPKSSNTSINIATPYTASYFDGTVSYGHYFNDTIKITNELILKNVKFGLVEQSNSNINIAGLGIIYQDEKAPVLYNYMYNAGYISRRMFSTYFSTTSQTGALIFGGVDKNKYSDLGLIPILDPQSYTINLQQVSIDSDIINDSGYLILLDTGSDASLIPEELWHQMHQAYDGKITSVPISGMESEPGYNYIFKCQNAKPFILDFSGKKVTMKPENLIFTLYDYNGQAIVDSESGAALCASSLVVTLDRETGFIFGTNLLKGLYVSWDVDNMELGIADAVFNSGEQLVEVNARSEQVPNAKRASNYDNVVTSYNSQYVSPTSTSLNVDSITTSTAYTGPFVTSDTFLSKSTFTLQSSSSSSCLTRVTSSLTDSPVPDTNHNRGHHHYTTSTSNHKNTSQGFWGWSWVWSIRC